MKIEIIKYTTSFLLRLCCALESLAHADKFRYQIRGRDRYTRGDVFLFRVRREGRDQQVEITCGREEVGKACIVLCSTYLHVVPVREVLEPGLSGPPSLQAPRCGTVAASSVIIDNSRKHFHSWRSPRVGTFTAMSRSARTFYAYRGYFSLKQVCSLN